MTLGSGITSGVYERNCPDMLPFGPARQEGENDTMDTALLLGEKSWPPLPNSPLKRSRGR